MLCWVTSTERERGINGRDHAIHCPAVRPDRWRARSGPAGQVRQPCSGDRACQALMEDIRPRWCRSYRLYRLSGDENHRAADIWNGAKRAGARTIRSPFAVRRNLRFLALDQTAPGRRMPTSSYQDEHPYSREVVSVFNARLAFAGHLLVPPRELTTERRQVMDVVLDRVAPRQRRQCSRSDASPELLERERN